MQAVIHDILTKDWYEEAVSDEKLRAQGLQDIGLTAGQIESVEQRLQDARSEAQNDTLIDQWRDERYRMYRSRVRRSGHDGFLDLPTEGELEAFQREFQDRHHKRDADHARVYFEKLRDVLRHLAGLIELKVEGTETLSGKAPLFLLHSPKVQGSEVLYQETESNTRSEAYALSILGTGLGQSASIRFSVSSALVSRAGAYKRVYVPLTLQRSLIGVYDRGARVREFGRLEYVVPPARAFEIGVEEMTREDFLRLAGAASGEVRAYTLSGDSRGSVHVFRTSLGATSEITLDAGVEAFGSKAAGTMKLTRNREVTLECKLPSGFDYEMTTILGGLGIAWADPV